MSDNLQEIKPDELVHQTGEPQSKNLEDAPSRKAPAGQVKQPDTSNAFDVSQVGDQRQEASREGEQLISNSSVFSNRPEGDFRVILKETQKAFDLLGAPAIRPSSAELPDGTKLSGVESNGKFVSMKGEVFDIKHETGPDGKLRTTLNPSGKPGDGQVAKSATKSQAQAGSLEIETIASSTDTATQQHISEESSSLKGDAVNISTAPEHNQLLQQEAQLADPIAGKLTGHRLEVEGGVSAEAAFSQTLSGDPGSGRRPTEAEEARTPTEASDMRDRKETPDGQDHPAGDVAKALSPPGADQEESRGKSTEEDEEIRQSIDTQPGASSARSEDEGEHTDEAAGMVTGDQEEAAQTLVRERYVVELGDTLESIGARRLSDQALAPLILEINSAILPTRNHQGKIMVNLEKDMVIFLPHIGDIEEYRNRLFSAAPPEFHYPGQYGTPEEELEAMFGTGEFAPSQSPIKRDVNHTDDLQSDIVASAKIAVVKLPVSPEPKPAERLKYKVRLGDTLKAVAIKHPTLGDESLWKLLAEVNGLSTACDVNGVPTAALKRGSTIWIPSEPQIARFRELSSNPEESAEPPVSN